MKIFRASTYGLIFLSFWIINCAGSSKGVSPKKGKNLEYPKALYVTAIGTSENNLDEAKRKGTIEVQRQISVHVKAKITDEINSLTSNGKQVYLREEVSSWGQLYTKGQIEGIQIVDTYEINGVYHALAILDKQNFASNCRKKIGEHRRELETVVRGSMESAGKKDLGEAIRKLKSSTKIIQKILTQRSLLSAVDDLHMDDELNYTPFDIGALYAKYIEGLKIVKVSGDNQSISRGNNPEPLLAKVTYGGDAVPNFPYDLRIKGGKIISEGITDEKGIITYNISPSKISRAGTHEFVLKFPERLPSDLKKKMRRISPQFSIKVMGKPCAVNLVIRTPGIKGNQAKMVKRKVSALLSKFGIHASSSKNQLTVDVAVNQREKVKGFSGSNQYQLLNISLSLVAVDANGKGVFQSEKSGSGTGTSWEEAVSKGLEGLKLEEELLDVSKGLCWGSN